MNTQLELSDVYKIHLHPIMGPTGKPDDETCNCVIVTAREAEGQWQLVDITSTNASVPAKHHFVSWGRKNNDGSPEHRSEQMGATHYGLIYLDMSLHPESSHVAAQLKKVHTTLWEEALKRSQRKDS